ncbi:GDSL-type esterase/lipase family protein [Mesobacillus foraminis]|uniref:Concanavalin A-like lectin/glucanase superfamily protein n=1 Tax=Mesobacillus foraminis TaxID=279826 RepID=A0A4R2BEU6_9BACI|nr:GDSL-type esterase/lipase family protein [Mesobacillus foraminis]TCN25478.1 concanavalin A-like lectin/glucanase superfamily protein [Mesobacillus foraminis]
MADAPKLIEKDNLVTAYPKINASIDNANEALNKASTAETNATSALSKSNTALTQSGEAKTTANGVKDEFDRVVAEAGSNNPEVVQARGTAVNLNARLNGVDSLLAETAKKETVSTTTGQRWTTTKEQTIVTLDNEGYTALVAPKSYRKRIVFYGSSTTSGYGPTDILNSYVERLKIKLGALGFDVINRGKGSDTTQLGIDRFFKDVVPAKPDFITLAFTIGNEGITSAKTTVENLALYKQFRDNYIKLINMARQNGIVPIVFTQALTTQYNDFVYSLALKLTEEIKAMGVMTVGWTGITDNLSKRVISGMLIDSVHYNDATHLELSNAIPPTLFDKVRYNQVTDLKSPNTRRYARIGAYFVGTPIYYTPMSTTDITTFSIFLRFRRQAVDNTLGTILSVNANNRVYFQAHGGLAINFTGSNESGVETFLDSNKTKADGIWHSLGLTFNNFDKKLRVYIDGVFQVELASPNVFVDKITIGGRGTTTYTSSNTDIKDFALYRTRLTDKEIKKLHEEGVFTQSSLEIYSPFHDDELFPGGNVVNLACTSVNLVVNELQTDISINKDA